MDNTDFFMMETEKPKVKPQAIEKEKIEKVEATINLNKEIPNGYIKVDLESTNNRLFTPSCLHFRNFYLDDIKELVQYKDGIELFNRLMSILTRMNYEKFDCSNLHIEELTEIMVKLFITFISEKLKDMKYKIDLSEPYTEENTGRVDVDLTKLNIKAIDSNVKGLFTIKIDNDVNDSITFSFPKISYLVLANKFVAELLKEDKEQVDMIQSKIDSSKVISNKIDAIHKTLFDIEHKLLNVEFKEEQRMAVTMQASMLKSELSRAEKEKEMFEPTKEELEFIENYENKKKMLYLETYQKLCIEKVNGKEISLIEKANLNIDFRYFVAYNEVINSNKFGIENNYTFYCPKNKETITRSFPFRINELIPSLGVSNNTRYNICFD